MCCHSAKKSLLLSLENYKTKHVNMNGLKIIVLAKQVPDTRNVGKDAMKEDGTVNRQALPAIFNPEDLNALEQALRIKDSYPASTVTLLTMGPVRAADIIREGLFRGADDGYLLSDRAFAGSDTLATSYALSCAIRAIGEFDLIVCGRQAIDGDTAQVGPQVAEKLGIPQITYAEEILKIENGKIRVKRRLERGVETAEGPLPLVVTVNGSAPDCRPRNVKLMMKYKHAKSVSEKQDADEDYMSLFNERPYLNINEMGVKDIEVKIEELGIGGSPTKVKKIENVVFQAKDSKRLTNSDADIQDMMVELIANHTLG
jgi:electron transfer flavoprotein beta subunit